MGFTLTFWGVRGTVPCPMASHMGFGGNTSCVELTAGDRTLILDAGTGIRLLGRRLLDRGVSRATLLLSHTHLDHISGFPFFAPVYTPGFALEIVSGHLCAAGGAEAVLEGQMRGPLFPVPYRALAASLSVTDVEPGSTLDLGDGLSVRTAPLNHPDGATGYRVDYAGRSVAYVTDTEHVPGQIDRNILGLIAGCDLVLYDSTYTDEEYRQRVGWGHSTWTEGMRLAQAAGVGRLVLFHHDPDRDDAGMAALEAEAQAAWPGRVFAAREGVTIDLLSEASAG
ncbi:MBL fold metallo-hydrolase [Azospirillum sp. TSO22-1]|uniref:MBL fold metallo-hydrolase n=1 Tax=Azospirillum sp. TSO22-1 TaxID=716789 RepID=UPI000D6035F3|nr:MBL fold metallo-hydrolase [Azospirillum sp. TSO22-1]PWC53931.1 beta-lactamase [Azospirillum sp. TSO22-1]